MLNEVLAEFELVARLEVVAEFEPSESTLIGDEHNNNKNTPNTWIFICWDHSVNVLAFWSTNGFCAPNSLELRWDVLNFLGFIPFYQQVNTKCIKFSK